MKRVFVTILAMLTLLAPMARAEVNPTDAFVGRWEDARVAGASMKILPKYLEDEGAEELAVYPIEFAWTTSGGRQVIWTMTARYNREARRLEYRDGVKTEDGRTLWKDGNGSLSLDGSGYLSWTDAREDAAAKLALARQISSAPTAQDFADGYFRVVAQLDRSAADARTRAAQTVARVLEFAREKDLWNADGDAMQKNLEAGWKALTQAERDRFADVFDDAVMEPADAAFDDYSEYRRVYEKAGVGEAMKRLTASPEVRLSWDFLSSATFNMGNMSDRAYDGAVG